MQSLRQVEGIWQSDTNTLPTTAQDSETIVISDTITIGGYSPTNSHTDNLQYLRDTLKKLLGKWMFDLTVILLIHCTQTTSIVDGRRRKTSSHGENYRKYLSRRVLCSRTTLTWCNCLVENQ